jgi:hypothetical protein
MRNRPRHTPDAVERLRLAIDCLPVATREAMLAGVDGGQRVIVGAYTDAHGGVCPMLAAHRGGARTNFLAFARSWDRFARAGRTSRPATARELRILLTQLEASLSETIGLEFDEAIREHRRLHTKTLLARLQRSRAGAAEPRADEAGLASADPPGSKIRARRRLPARRRRRPAGAHRATA